MAGEDTEDEGQGEGEDPDSSAHGISLGGKSLVLRIGCALREEGSRPLRTDPARIATS
jgi:hypothetical protein